MRLEWFILALAGLFFLIVVEFVRRRKLTESFVIIWAGVALGGLVLVLARNLIDEFSSWVGVENGTSVVFAGAILFLMVLSVYVSMHLTAAEKRIESLAEEVALLRGIRRPIDEKHDHHRQD